MKSIKLSMFYFVLCFLSIHLKAESEAINIAIMPFIDASNRLGQQDILISELTNELLKYKFLRIIDRSQQDAILKEIRFGMTGLVDEATAAKVGKMHGVQLMIFGAIADGRITARAVHVSTQKVVAAANVSKLNEAYFLAQGIASGIETFLARENLKSLRNENIAIKPELWATKNFNGQTGTKAEVKVNIGDSLVFHFRSNANGYLTIVDIQPGGDLVIIYPNDMAPDNRVKGGTTYSIPSVDDGFEILVSEPAGFDNVLAFFTKRKVDWLDRKSLEGDGFWTVKRGEKLGLARGLKVAATKLKESEWATATIVLDVQPALERRNKEEIK